MTYDVFGIGRSALLNQSSKSRCVKHIDEQVYRIVDCIEQLTVNQ